MQNDLNKFIRFCALNAERRKLFFTQDFPRVEFDGWGFFYQTESPLRLLLTYGQIWLTQEFEQSLFDVDAKIKYGFYALIFLASEELSVKEAVAAAKECVDIPLDLWLVINRYANKVINSAQISEFDALFEPREFLSRADVRLVPSSELTCVKYPYNTSGTEISSSIEFSQCGVDTKELLKYFLLFFELDIPQRKAAASYEFLEKKGINCSGNSMQSLMRLGRYWLAYEANRSLISLDAEIKEGFLALLAVMTEGACGQGYLSDMEIADDNDIFGTSGLLFVFRDYANMLLSKLIDSPSV
jgi:hypothetical protein